ncbi:sigma-54-dependent transcriptional regulator [Desulfatitalea alkaliphila]|uniref:Sigma-54 dependent transcriptional regulator n=1 Tax=Desulfatitalea alkaliphila TaxID=2929485 RepID=A0AA41R3V2_9BACT|nr:sigma-54 dependent transcriptional regulator [Desulfatitalea alkaliphila]
MTSPASSLPPLTIAVVEDEAVARKQIGRILARRNFQVTLYEDPIQALRGLQAAPAQIVLSDIRMPHMDGLTLLQRIKAAAPTTEVVLFTGYAAIDDAVQAIKHGAFDYIEKPLTPEKIMAVLQRAADKLALLAENKQLREELLKKDNTREILGISPHIRELIKVINKVARIDCNVLIHGESGTGKELVARAIHNGSLRKHKPFVGFNCGGFAEELIANELFGHEKGAFTGADSVKQGLFEAAAGGTVFLDEIGEMALPTQVKLLRVLQERQVLRVGGNKSIPLDIRLISATNKDLEHEVQAGRFREDLFFRLKVVVIRTPPLRDRPEDIPLLADHFLRAYNRLYNKAFEGFTRKAADLLLRYPFPGNVRELEHMVCSAVALGEDKWVDAADLPEDLNLLEVDTVTTDPLSTLAEQEKAHIIRALEATNYNKVRTAKILGIPRTSLWRKMKKYGVDELRPNGL